MVENSMANQGLSELKEKLEHWDEKTPEEKVRYAEKVVALSMLSSRSQVRLQAAKVILETYAKKQAHGLSGSTGDGDSFGDEDEYDTDYRKGPRSAV